MTVELDGAGGRWSATVDGTPRGGTFTATACDYDAFLPPAAASPVTDLRIREVALFQGVKIPLAREPTREDDAALVWTHRKVQGASVCSGMLGLA